jgi:serpin B
MTNASPAEPDWIARANNTFALNLYAKLSGAPGNIFFSPSSIETALAMTYAGARGQTATQMATVLHLPHGDAIHADLGAFIRRLNGGGADAKSRGYELDVANALWGQQGEHFLPGFTTILDKDYGAGLRELDYKHDPDGARKSINDWAAAATHDKIQNLIPPGVLDAQTVMTLTSAIYFKGTWTGQFNKAATHDELFHRTASESGQVPAMHRTASCRYAETDDCQALQLDYLGNAVSMIILLPRKVDGLSALEKELTSEKLSALTGSMPEQRVIVTLPKFKLTQSMELADALAAMGMPDAFSRRADFSGMTSGRPVNISNVIHKAYIDVNEEGTVAAAATAVVMRSYAVMQQGEPPVFRADHPFLFLIQDEASGAILFMGRVAAPDAGD